MREARRIAWVLAVVCVAEPGMGARPRVAAADTLCVNPGATDGCFGTIGQAVAAASPGDTIVIAGSASTYPGTWSSPRT